MNNLLKQTLAISVLSIFLGLAAIAAPAKKPYGLGIPISSGTGGAVRSIANSLLIPLAPEDGGRTATERPTFYWYLPSSNNFPYKVIFELRDPTDNNGTVIFKAEGIATNAGLYKLTLPQNSPALKPERVYLWQLRLRGSTASSNLQSIGSIVLTKVDEDMQKAIAKASTNNQKAQVFSDNGYWFDALNIYTSQIDSGSKDQTAAQMRASMLKEVFNSPTAGSPDEITNVTNLIEKINSVKATELSAYK
jgi:hypothetical protein